MSLAIAPSAQASPSMPRPRQKPGSACQECRRRKLGCDRAQPRCSVCVDTGKECIVTAANPRGPKRGHIKALQARIAALEDSVSNKQTLTVEGLSDKSASSEGNSDTVSEDVARSNPEAMQKLLQTPIWAEGYVESNDIDASLDLLNIESSFQHGLSTIGVNDSLLENSLPIDESMGLPHMDLAFAAMSDHSNHSSVSPTAYDELSDQQEGLSDLLHADRDQLYFDRVHCFVPIIRQSDYHSWSQDPMKTEAQACLQQAMWALATSASAQYQSTSRCIYASARRGLIQLETKNRFPTTIETAQVQAFLLLALYEFMRVDFHRGWMTAGHAFRLIQLGRWHEIDLMDTSATTTIPEWVEVESQRRAFWLAFVLDRFMSMRHRTPPTISEQAITVRIPSPDSNFQAGKPTLTETLSDAVATNDPVARDSFTELVLIATICGRAVSHCHRASVERGSYCNNNKPPQDFLSRHQWLCSVLSVRSVALTMTNHFDPTTISLQMMVQGILLYLQQLLETFVPQTDEDRSVTADTVVYAEAAVQQIANLAKLLPSLGCYKIHPLVPVPLCLCVEYLTTTRSVISNSQESLRLILRALSVVKQVNILGQDSVALLSPGTMSTIGDPVTTQSIQSEVPSMWY